MYGEGRNSRYVIGFGLVIVLLFIVIFMIIHGGDNKSKVPETKRALTSYAGDTNFTVTETIVGPITATQTHEEIQINVTNSASTIDIIKGYDDSVIDSRSYPMSTESFREFLNALDKAKFTNGSTDKDLKNDKGYCSTGQRYVFEVYQGANQLQRFWATSCGGPKSFKGNLSLTNILFQAQIPDYTQITNSATTNSSFNGL